MPRTPPRPVMELIGWSWAAGLLVVVVGAAGETAWRLVRWLLGAG